MASISHHERITTYSNVLMTLGTIAAAAFAWQSNQLNKRLTLSTEEPVLALSVVYNGPGKNLRYELTNGSAFALEDIEIADYFYAAQRSLDFYSAIPLGGQTVVPQHKIERLRASESKQLSTPREPPSPKQIEVLKTGRLAVLHLDITYRHAVTHKLYERTDRFIILPSETGWRINKVLTGTAWAAEHFDKAQ